MRLNCVKASPRLRRRTTTSAILSFERARPWLTKGHAPEVGLRRNELESEDSFSFTSSPRRHYFALHRLSRVLIEQYDSLVRSEFRVQGNQTPELADGLSVRAKDEIFAVQRLPIHAKRHSQRHARGAAPFDAPVVGNLHMHKSGSTRSGWESVVEEPSSALECYYVPALLRRAALLKRNSRNRHRRSCE
jgi:hypothetical protein